VGGGLHVNLPAFAPGDYVEGEVNYSQGATKYVNNTPFTVNQLYGTGATETFGITSDCVYGGNVVAGNATNCHLTTAFSVVGALEHYWTPQWHESFSVSYGGQRLDTTANNILCSAEGGGNGAGVGTAAAATAGCNNNFSYWTAGTRLQWDVTKSFYVGVEALYIGYDSAKTFNGLIPSTVGVAAPSTCGLANGNCSVTNESAWVFTLRAHKDFLP